MSELSVGPPDGFASASPNKMWHQPPTPCLLAERAAMEAPARKVEAEAPSPGACAVDASPTCEHTACL